MANVLVCDLRMSLSLFSDTLLSSNMRSVLATVRCEIQESVSWSLVTYQLLELILDTCPTAKANDIKLYSRWMRAILRILLHRNGAEEEAESLKYAEKALDVLKTSLGKSVGRVW